MLVGEIDGPDPGACADVEDAVQSLRFRDRGRVEAAFKGQAEEVVLEIEAVIFALIVGEDVCAILAVC